jgi:hypothetical protein
MFLTFALLVIEVRLPHDGSGFPPVLQSRDLGMLADRYVDHDKVNADYKFFAMTLTSIWTRTSILNGYFRRIIRLSAGAILVATQSGQESFREQETVPVKRQR